MSQTLLSGTRGGAGGGALPNGTTATTQAPGDNSAKVATDAFVEAALVSGGLLTAVAVLTNGQLNGLLSAPVELIPAPGVGFMIVPVDAIYDITNIDQFVDNNPSGPVASFCDLVPALGSAYAVSTNPPATGMLSAVTPGKLAANTGSYIMRSTATFPAGGGIPVLGSENADDQPLSMFQDFASFGAIPFTVGAGCVVTMTIRYYIVPVA